MRHFGEICEPYEFEKENAVTGSIEIIRKMSDCVSSEHSLLKLMRQYLSGRHLANKEGGDDIVDEDEDAEDMLQGDGSAEFVEQQSDTDENGGVCEKLNSELQYQ